MRQRMRHALLDAMEKGCTFIDRIPFWIGPLRRLGCPHGLATWAFRLEDRWGMEPSTGRPRGGNPGAGG